MVVLALSRRRQSLARQIEFDAPELLRRGPVRNPCDPGDHAALDQVLHRDLEAALARGIQQRAVAPDGRGLAGEALELHQALQPMRRSDPAHEDEPRHRRASGLLCGRLGRRGLRGGVCLGPLLRLGLGQMLLGLVAALRCLGQAELRQKQRHAVRRLGALAQPILDALDIELHPLGAVMGQHGIVDPHLLDEAAVARHARFGDDDAVVGALLGPAAGQANLQRHGDSFLLGCAYSGLWQTASIA